MKTLVTGAGGYIGLHIVRELLGDGHHVTALVRSPDKLGPLASASRLTVVEVDLEDEARVNALLPGHDVCVHAALIWGDPGSELEVRDVAVTAKLFNAAGKSGLKRGIFLSSTAVHRPLSAEMREEDGLRTTDLYGATKAAGELFLRAACAHHPMAGTVLRLGPVVGPPAFASGSFRSPNRILEMMRAATEGNPVQAVRGEGRQLSDVIMVARAVRLLTRAEELHPTYLCVDRDILTWEQVAQMVMTCMSASGDVHIVAGERTGPIPHFQTQRIESLLGGPFSAKKALLEHIRHLSKVLGATSQRRCK